MCSLNSLSVHPYKSLIVLVPLLFPKMRAAATLPPVLVAHSVQKDSRLFRRTVMCYETNGDNFRDIVIAMVDSLLNSELMSMLELMTRALSIQDVLAVGVRELRAKVCGRFIGSLGCTVWGSYFLIDMYQKCLQLSAGTFHIATMI